MAIGDLVTDDFMFEYAGVAFGGCCDTGMDYVDITGLDGPPMRSGDINRPRDHGMLAGVDFLGGRTIDIRLNVVGTSAADLDAKLTQLATLGTSVGNVEQPLVFQLPGQGKRRINARLRRRAFPVDLSYSQAKFVTVALQFQSMDPRIYDNTATTTALTLPTASGGLHWPVSWPLAWGSAIAGFINFVNLGTFSTRPVVTFFGPLTAPYIQNLTTGEAWISTYDLLNGDSLVIDFDARTVLLNGTASRYSSLRATSVWWELHPGTTQLQIGAVGGSGTASITARSAWI